MQRDHDAASTTWELCATVDQTRQLVRLVAQPIGVELHMTSLRIDTNGPHRPCDEALPHHAGAGIDGYVVTISCAGSPDVMERLHGEIAATIQGCLTRPKH